MTEGSTCAMCGAAGARPVRYYQNIGMILVRRHSTLAASLCLRCSAATYARFTSINLVLGWWGLASFFVTPFNLAFNAVRFLGNGAARGPTPAPSKMRQVVPPGRGAMLLLGSIACLAALWIAIINVYETDASLLPLLVVVIAAVCVPLMLAGVGMLVARRAL